MERLVLIDGNSLANRAFYALPLLMDKKGVYTNSVYGFTQIVLRILKEVNPDYVLVAFDAGKFSFRNEKYNEYKGTRMKTPLELNEQFPLIKELLDILGLSYFELVGYEADDIIGTVSDYADQKGIETIIYSGDKDLFQLISDHTTVQITRKGITEMDVYDRANLMSKYNLKPSQMTDLKGLMGDSSDNIPGVPGVGEKTALTLLNEYKTLENVLENIDNISGNKLKENLRNYQETATLSKWLATIDRNVPMALDLGNYRIGEANNEKLVEFFKRLGFKSLLDRIGQGDVEKTTTEVNFSANVKIYPQIDREKWQKYFSEKRATALAICLDKQKLPKQEIAGLAISDGDECVFMRLADVNASDIFHKYFADDNAPKYCFDSKSNEIALFRAGLQLAGVRGDLMLSNYLLDPAAGTFELAEIANRYSEINLESEEQIFGKGAKWTLPDESVLARYLGAQATAIYQLIPILEKLLAENQMLELLEEIELPLARVLANMEKRGFKIDIAKLKEMGKDLDRRLNNLIEEIYELAGEEFNLNSPKQLSEILFERLELPVIKKTKTGYSTDADVLEKLEPYHPIIEKILLYRQLAKLQSTYIDGLLKVVNHETGHVYTTFNQALTTTGRLSSTDPNLQNIPIRLEEGRKIREAFVASNAGWTLMSADYSQIELRVLAHIANDETLIEAFKNNKDIHTSTAMEVFDLAESAVTPFHRRQAKAVNFGIVYGISDYGLSQNLNISRKEAQDFIDRYFAIYPAVKEYMNNTIAAAKKTGYVSTLANRRRYLPDINSTNFNLRSFAERTAINTPIQGTAADIIKIAMLRVDRAIKKDGFKSHLKLQVHDELICEVAPDELVQMRQLITDEMENAMQLNVPIKIDMNEGKNWYEAK